ncbi:MAG: hypothetical protein HY287_07740 [Planctomycetes bacterium]|nr:hypothetical protein [Planctomycetota bacterium]MBI3834203.1 hypothetical protein [Planctomycetota bacterium]
MTLEKKYFSKRTHLKASLQSGGVAQAGGMAGWEVDQANGVAQVGQYPTWEHDFRGCSIEPSAPNQVTHRRRGASPLYKGEQGG